MLASPHAGSLLSHDRRTRMAETPGPVTGRAACTPGRRSKRGPVTAPVAGMHFGVALALSAGCAVLPRQACGRTPVTVYSFQGAPDGATPFAGLTYYNGFLYGTTGFGGSGSGFYGGTVFKVNVTTGAETVVHSFSGSDGVLPMAPLVVFRGILYGAVVEGGPFGFGCLYKVDPSTDDFQVIYNFGSRHNDKDGAYPGTLVPYAGALYGIAGGGDKYGHGDGVIFRFDPATSKEKVLYRFAGAPDGAGPSGFSLVGNLFYGTTSSGGANNQGTLFAFDPAAGMETVLYSFGPVASTDAKDPAGGLAASGNLLVGASVYGGTRDNGTIFQFDLGSGTESVLHSFAGAKNGINPNGPPYIWNSIVYGSLNEGGESGNGALFSADLATGAARTYYRFTGGSDGGEPYGGLIEHDGYLYGTTGVGGTANLGTVFKVKR